MIYTSRLSTKVKGKNYFAEIQIGVNTYPAPGLQIKFHSSISEEWKSAVRFGFEYAWNQIVGLIQPSFGLSITVLEIREMPGDTTPAMVAHVAADVLWKATNYAPYERPAIDEKKGGIFFPR